MDKYKEGQLRLTKMQDANWVKTINKLKTLGCDAKDKEYCVFYKENNQGEQKKYPFNAVQYVEETKRFIFTKFNTNSLDYNEILDTVDSTEVLLDIEIEKYTSEEDNSDYDFIISHSYL